ncbi:MAG: hypothetical protein NXI20_04835 [bacterium]|nr:hypothetical protein [bacterium]
MNARKFSFIVALVIVLYGIFGTLLIPHFQNLVETIIGDEDLAMRLNSKFVGSKLTDLDQFNLGKFFVYTPIYLGLHILLINSIFWQSKFRIASNLVFMSIICLIVLVAVFSLKFGFTSLYFFANNLFHKLTKLPLILFLVEGGRLLLSDVDKMLGID